MGYFLIKIDKSENGPEELHSIIESMNSIVVFKYKLDKLSPVYYKLQIEEEFIFLVDLLAIRSIHAITIGRIIEDKNHDSELCYCRGEKPSRSPTLSSEVLKLTYLRSLKANKKIYKFFTAYKNTKVLDSFIANNTTRLSYKFDECPECTKYEKIEIITHGKCLSELHKRALLTEEYSYLIRHRVDLKTPTHKYRIHLNVGSSDCIITEEYYITNRKFFFSNSIKSLLYIGKTAMPIEYSVFTCNILNIQPGSLLVDPCCGSGSILFAASLFGIYTLGSDFDLSSIIGRNRVNIKKNIGFGISNTRTQLYGYRVRSNFEHFGTLKYFLGVARGNIFNSFYRWADYLITDLPYGVRSTMENSSIDYLECLNKLAIEINVKGFIFWVEGGLEVDIKSIFPTFRLQYTTREVLRTCTRELYVFIK